MNHIETKDKFDSISKIIGDFFNDTKQKIALANAEFLSQHLDYSIHEWYHSRNVHLNAFLKQVYKSINADRKQALKSIMAGLDGFNLEKKDIESIKQSINKGYDILIKESSKSVKRELPRIFSSSKIADKVLKSGPAEALRKTVTDYLNQNQMAYIDYLGKDGEVVRRVQWENWLEMVVRTELQSDATKTLIQTGKETGAIFYVCSYYGDCAPDHVECQAKGLFVDKDWKDNAPEDRIEEIENYIAYHKIPTIQEVSENAPYFTTRPNCRHFFQYISLDEVLGMKNKEDMNKYRAENNLTAVGKYKPEKYEALQKQRANERKIRNLKGKMEQAEALGDKQTEMVMKRKVLNAQKEQRELLQDNPFLERNYDREAYRKMITNFRIK